MRLQIVAELAVTPIAVGNPAVLGNNFFNSSQRTVVDRTTPATGTGTLTTADIYTEIAGTVYVMTGTLSGSNYTVRAISGALSASAGLNSLGVSLSIVAGDYIGLYLPSGSGAQIRFTSGVGTRGNAASPASPPVATNVIALSTGVGTLSIGGTG